MFVELLNRLDVDVRHLGDVEYQALVDEFPVQAAGDVGCDFYATTSDFAVDCDIADLHTASVPCHSAYAHENAWAKQGFLASLRNDKTTES